MGALASVFGIIGEEMMERLLAGGRELMGGPSGCGVEGERSEVWEILQWQ